MAHEMNNRQAFFHYFIEDRYVAGIVLLGSEVKSIREGKLSFNDAYCFFDNGELWMKGLYIGEYSRGTVNNHIAVHDRKLLLSKKELKKWEGKMKDKGLTIVPLRVFFSEKQLVKVEIGLARGKKLHDKRDTIRSREVEREIKRHIK
ncbi:MAG: SsrA-binding protein SmpB [Chitinophagia bacterium]|nr:SsrA-binding protein SmpB [Chitinophagia bacterium]